MIDNIRNCQKETEQQNILLNRLALEGPITAFSSFREYCRNRFDDIKQQESSNQKIQTINHIVGLFKKQINEIVKSQTEELQISIFSGQCEKGHNQLIQNKLSQIKGFQELVSELKKLLEISENKNKNYQTILIEKDLQLQRIRKERDMFYDQIKKLRQEKNKYGQKIIQLSSKNNRLQRMTNQKTELNHTFSYQIASEFDNKTFPIVFPDRVEDISDIDLKCVHQDSESLFNIFEPIFENTNQKIIKRQQDQMPTLQIGVLKQRCNIIYPKTERIEIKEEKNKKQYSFLGQMDKMRIKTERYLQIQNDFENRRKHDIERRSFRKTLIQSQVPNKKNQQTVKQKRFKRIN